MWYKQLGDGGDRKNKAETEWFTGVAGPSDGQLRNPDWNDQGVEDKRDQKAWNDGELGCGRNPGHEGHATKAGPYEARVAHSSPDQVGTRGPF